MIDDGDERRGLLKFVPPIFLPVKVLLIDSEEYFPDVRKLLPDAQIFITSEQNLPTSPKTFELIIAQELLTAGEDFYLRLLRLNRLLKDSGALLTQFTEKIWLKARIVKLLSDATYKEIHFLPDENFWLVKACKSTAEVAALKEIFTPEVRAELSRLLHRVEYDIDAEENFQRLINLCEREGIFDEYLSDFINQVVVHDSAKNFLKVRAESFGRKLNFGE